ncbi:hypothetical protein [Skermania sp. ID1734]|uniref:hypothetical protein n=1 Tax=Skermania sp. ID1734 TaxID=2597516 RepID=UPI00163DABE0|nr:hypothetical protein [Skermania sp. ID1734]
MDDDNGRHLAAMTDPELRAEYERLMCRGATLDQQEQLRLAELQVLLVERDVHGDTSH